MAEEKFPRVVIVGAGFGGLEAAKKLACENVQLTVVDRTNYHLFQPLLYQVATAALSPADIAAPVRAILHKCENVEVILAEVQSIDVNKRIVHAGDLDLSYDYLIIATGARHSYFGHPEWERLAPGLKSLEDAVEIRRRILLAFEYAEKISDPAARAAALTFVIIGGGARVVLIEGEPQVLATFPEDLRVSAMKQLRDLGVEIRAGVHATDLTEDGLKVGNEFIPCRVKIWAAGNNASFVGKSLGVSVDQVGRVVVQDDLTIPGHPEVQVIGDLAKFTGKDGKPLPGVSPVAMQQGRHAGRNILAMVEGRKPQRFWYFDKGSMATIGRHKAVADLHLLHLSGLPAWLAWLFVHILFLVGFRNRVVVLVQWAWAYLTFNKGARLITRNFQAETRPPA